MFITELIAPLDQWETQKRIGCDYDGELDCYCSLTLGFVADISTFVYLLAGRRFIGG